MTVTLETDTIRLSADCPVGDAEPLLALLQEAPGRAVDLTGAGTLHTAVVQVLLALQPEVLGPAGDPFVDRWIAPLLPMRRSG
jgi:hypothetical protein